MTTEHKTRTFKPAETRDCTYGFTCERCAGRWVYYSASEALAHARQHERIPDGRPGPQPWLP